MRFEFNNINWNTTIDKVFGNSQGSEENGQGSVDNSQDGAKIKNLFKRVKEKANNQTTENIQYSDVKECVGLLNTILQEKDYDQEKSNIALGMLHIVRKHLTDGSSGRATDEEVSDLISEILTGILSGPLTITKENVGKIIDELHQDEGSWQKLYNLLEGSERNAEKGLLCDELYRKFAKQDPDIAKLCKVEKTVAATWSQHMSTETLLERLQDADPKFIRVTLLKNSFIEKHHGNKDILTKLLETAKADTQKEFLYMVKIINRGFIKSCNGDLDLLKQLLSQTKDEITLIKILVNNGFIEAVNESKGAEDEKNTIFKNLKGFLHEIQETGTKNDKTEASNLLKTIDQQITEPSHDQAQPPVPPVQPPVPPVQPPASSPARATPTTAAQPPASSPARATPPTAAQPPVPPVNTPPKQQRRETRTLEIPDNKANANKSILPLVGGATAGLAVGGLVAAAILSSASKIAFVEALKCYNIIVPVAIALAVMGGVIASQQSQTER
jgi:hypothetical protein